MINDALDDLQARMSKEDWLLGKERARVWTPVYQEPETPDATGDEKGRREKAIIRR